MWEGHLGCLEEMAAQGVCSWPPPWVTVQTYSHNASMQDWLLLKKKKFFLMEPTGSQVLTCL